MKRLAALLLLAVLLTGCTAPTPPETTAPSTEAATVPTTVPPTTQIPATVPQAMLRSGFYPLESATVDGQSADNENMDAANCYLFLETDGTGVLSMMGFSAPITWQDDQIFESGSLLPITLEEDRIILDAEFMVLTFRYQGETLPEAYLPQIPVGEFLVSSVGVNGDVSFYGSLDPANGSLTLKEDGTGTLIFDDLNGDVTIDDANIYYGDLVIPYMYYTAEMSPDGQAMLMIMLTDRTTSVIFRIAPAE